MTQLLSPPPSSSPAPLDDVDKRLLESLQKAIPVTRYPWTLIGMPLRIPGREVLRRITRLKETGVIRQISPIFDSAALGYTSVLAAAKVPASRVDQAASVVSAHPGVSHNYRRDAEFNLWFTLAVPPGEKLEDHLNRLAGEAGLNVVHPMPALRTFHIGVMLHMTGGEDSIRPDGGTAPARQPVTLTERDKQIIRVTQEDLPLVVRPFERMCHELAMPFADLCGWFARMTEAGALRRIAAILRHRQTGFVANGMGVWRIDEDKIEAAGRAAARFSAVSHCYQRPSYRDWPYNLYTMIHARTQDECEAVVDRIARELKPLGLRDRRVIYSTREYKKQRVRYFA